MKNIATLIVALSASLSLGGCYVYADTPSAAVATDAYSPMYYDGNVVYYDSVGAPFVWIGGSVRYVPRTYVHYDVLRSHYRRHSRGYHRWYQAHPYHRHHRVHRGYRHHRH
jgi:hypothetical protein